MTVPRGLEYYGDFGKVVGVTHMLRELIADTAGVEPDAILLPPEVMPGATQVYGLTVLRLPGVEPSLVYSAS